MGLRENSGSGTLSHVEWGAWFRSDVSKRVLRCLRLAPACSSSWPGAGLWATMEASGLGVGVGVADGILAPDRPSQGLSVLGPVLGRQGWRGQVGGDLPAGSGSDPLHRGAGSVTGWFGQMTAGRTVCPHSEVLGPPSLSRASGTGPAAASVTTASGCWVAGTSLLPAAVSHSEWAESGSRPPGLPAGPQA